MIQKHGLIAIFGQLPLGAVSLDLTHTFRMSGNFPKAQNGKGYGIIFETHDASATAKFGDKNYSLMEADLMAEYSFFTTGIPKIPDEIHKQFRHGTSLTEGTSTATPPVTDEGASLPAAVAPAFRAVTGGEESA